MANGDSLTLSERIESVGESVTGLDREAIDGIGFAVPYLALFVTFLLYPLVRGFWISLHEWNPFNPAQSEFVLFQNYVRMFNDPLFWTALQNTVWFVVLTVPTLVILGLLLALGVNRSLKGRRFLRIIFFSPYLLTVSVSSLVWMEMFSPPNSIINYYLGFVLSNPPQWLNSGLLAMPAIAITSVWWTVGFNFIILLAARQNIPETLYEAARLDGANSWNAFKDVTIPQMRQSLMFVVVVQFIASFQIFGQVYIMTDGGPGQATETIIFYLYRMAFQSQELGYAAALGYFLFFVLVGVSLINFYFLGGDNE